MLSKRSNQNFFAVAWLRVAALAAALILVAGINELWWHLSREEESQAQWVDHTHQVINLLEETLARSSDLLTGQRGFALTHEPDYLQSYFAATNRMPQLIESLREQTRDNPAQSRKLAELEPLLARHLELNRNHIETLLKGDPLNPDMDFRRAIKSSLDAIHLTIGSMVETENSLLERRREELQRTTRRVTLLNVAGGLVSFTLILGVFAALWRENQRRCAVEAELQRSHEQLEELVRQRTASLNLSEERLLLAKQAARIGTFEWNLQTGVNIWSPEMMSMHGLAPGGFTGTYPAWENLLHPDDRAETSARLQQSLETGSPSEGEWRVVWPDQTVRWLFGRWQVFKDHNGQPITLTGVNLDITDRKQLEREILEASDREMRRIGNDLHDGVGQQLTALSLFITSQEKAVQQQAPLLAEPFRKILTQLREIIRHIRVLSHGLSSISLENNGLVEALQKLSDDTRAIGGVESEFADGTAGREINPQVAVQLYRIGQEAVSNSLKHARAGRIHIALDAQPGKLELRVEDNGRGFSPNASRRQTGLGLRAMKYRANLIGSVLQIATSPGGGTRITCTLAKRN